MLRYLLSILYSHIRKYPSRICLGIRNWLPERDTSQTPQVQYIQLLVKVYKRRTKRFELSIDQPFPTLALKPVKKPKNIVRIALKVKAYTTINPGHSYSLVAENFNVSRARISQLLKIIDNLPAYFIRKIEETEDPILLRSFSGKKLLKIANLETKQRRQKEIKQLLKTL